jgi:hypothetical protein
METFKCKECGKKISSYKRNLPKNGKRSFCSPECTQKWQKQYFKEKRENAIKQAREKHPDGKKKCSECKKPYDLSVFGHKGGGYLNSRCPQCFSDYTTKRHNARKLAVIEFLGGKCKKCRKKVHPAAFSLHHVDPKTKELGWNKLRNRSIKTLIKEVKKCVLLCANCHSMEHSGGNNWENIEEMKQFFLQQLRDLDATGSIADS